ncbi:FadR/GntR family transcriptional regulator [Actinomadura sp. WMMB 499]|uniref:FadR/GntR family transcriptional regulator n=1 Tax=Actinomadura sp. WMMB 499 TaxID=1219491 RepID=UPI0012469FB5|nr:GntR family transcriptional regulator [Actinomadura sp. WMMB 499]QFG26217.1 FadR family transcriptional regulator [Actinomadura sp. WMMB 499]
MADGRRNGDRIREKPHRIADELRVLIASGELGEGDALGREAELVERFGVSRPSLREALRILEAEGLVTVVRGVRGGVVVHEPHERMAARTAAHVLQADGVPLADVFEARAQLEPLAARVVAASPGHASAAAELRPLVARQRACLDDPERFHLASAVFHERLVALAGNRTLSIVAEMITELLFRTVTAVGDGGRAVGSPSARRRGLRAQERLIALLEEGDADGAERHWRAYMQGVKRLILGHTGTTVVEVEHHYPAGGAM